MFTDRMKKAITYAVNQEQNLRRAGGGKDFMADMMPWSEAYRTYEEKKQQQRQSLYGQLFPEPERPRTPRKRDRSVEVPESDGLTA